ncbi:MAG: hypothetical protein ABIV06_04895 [Thermoanaerobaculia bacterium]
MSTALFDLMQQPLPLRLRRVHQLQATPDEPALFEDFSRPLQSPATSSPERFATTERLLYARRRASGAA